MFDKLKFEDLNSITKLLMKELCVRLKKRNVTMTIDPSVYEYIVDKIDNTKFGARPIKRAIQQYIEDKICDEMIDIVYDTSKRYHVILNIVTDNLDIKLDTLKPGDTKRSNIC